MVIRDGRPSLHACPPAGKISFYIGTHTSLPGVIITPEPSSHLDTKYSGVIYVGIWYSVYFSGVVLTTKPRIVQKQERREHWQTRVKLRDN